MQFLYALYQTPQDAQQLARQYVALGTRPKKLSKTKRYDFVAWHLAAIRQDTLMWAHGRQPGHFDTTRYQVKPYAAIAAAASTPNFLLTKKQQQQVYVLVKDEQPVQYFLVEGRKISSFAYMTKGMGGPSYFFGY